MNWIFENKVEVDLAENKKKGPEYTISGSYSSDRLRGARPMGSHRRPAVAGLPYSPVVFRISQTVDGQRVTLNRLCQMAQAIQRNTLAVSTLLDTGC